jgi:hypothetical protein
MAEHVSEQIIAAVKVRLSGLPTTGARVFDSRVHPVQTEDVPCIKVDQGDESAEYENVNVPEAIRTMELLVVACVKQNVAYRTEVNKIRKEVEAAIGADLTLGGICHDVQYNGCEIELSGEAEHPIAEATITFGVLYITDMRTPDVPVF